MLIVLGNQREARWDFLPVMLVLLAEYFDQIMLFNDDSVVEKSKCRDRKHNGTNWIAQ
jgi:hypothetical protein